MKTFETFHIQSHSFDAQTLQASFSFSFDHEVEFTETIDFACEGFVPTENMDPNVIQNLLFHLSLAVGISYYKLVPPEKL